MRNLAVMAFVTLDGVMQAPGTSDEDRSGGFTHGGWVAGYWDDFVGRAMNDQMKDPFDLLLGRKTYDLFEGYWPTAGDAPGAKEYNRARKYVVSRRRNKKLSWANSELVSGNIISKIKKLKKGDGPELQVHGSSHLIQTLLKHDLIDEFRLKIFPITLGKGKRLFAEGTIPSGFELVECKASPRGVVIATYRRVGAIITGPFTDFADKFLVRTQVLRG